MHIIYYFRIVKFHRILKNIPSSLFNINNIFSSMWIEYIFWEQKKNGLDCALITIFDEANPFSSGKQLDFFFCSQKMYSIHLEEKILLILKREKNIFFKIR